MTNSSTTLATSSGVRIRPIGLKFETNPVAGGAGADVEDPAVVGDRAGRHLEGEECALGVDCEELVELLLGEVGDGQPGVLKAGVHDDDVGFAEGTLCIGEQSFEILDVRDAGADGHGPAAARRISAAVSSAAAWPWA